MGLIYTNWRDVSITTQQKKCNITVHLQVNMQKTEIFSFLPWRGMWAECRSESLWARWCCSPSILISCHRDFTAGRPDTAEDHAYIAKPASPPRHTGFAGSDSGPLHSLQWWANCSPPPSPHSHFAPQHAYKLLGRNRRHPENLPSTACRPSSINRTDGAWHGIWPDRGVSSAVHPHLPRLLHRDPWRDSPQFHPEPAS